MFFFFEYTPSTAIYTYVHTLSLHYALPIWTPIGVRTWKGRCWSPPTTVPRRLSPLARRARSGEGSTTRTTVSPLPCVAVGRAVPAASEAKMSLMPQGSAQSAATSPPASASMSAAAMLLGWRVRIGVWWRIASFTLLSRRITQIGRAHVGTPVTNAHLVFRLLLEKK